MQHFATDIIARQHIADMHQEGAFLRLDRNVTTERSTASPIARAVGVIRAAALSVLVRRRAARA